MIRKDEMRTAAIKMRTNGRSYSEILKDVPVAKSTLSLWLRDVQLARKQTQRLTDRRYAAQLRGAAVRRKQRIDSTKLAHETAIREVGSISDRERLLIGAALYWAEGTKEKAYRHASGVDFANTDVEMIKFILLWMTRSCKVPREDIYANLYIHEYQRKNVPAALKYWTSATGLSAESITGVYFKRHNPKTSRHNNGEMYYGTLRVRIRRSSALQRKIQGWVMGMCR